MPKDRTGEEATQDPDPWGPCWRCGGTGWLTPPDDDHPQLCPGCRTVRGPRPVREYFEPVPSERAAKAIERRELAEKRLEAERARVDVESPVTLGKETRT